MTKVTLKPVGELRVRLEDGSGYLPTDGQAVALTAYYRRRLADGDVEVISEPITTAKSAAGQES
ncbi:DUF2635 domain-containing protein [Pseudogulbenkiania ferrooxidans]|uniref:DUF2635 domain-containing protein n=1 Tax=Pseudogulbenkiania ferrooxidans 2002 TaxID=279714 RepID=B9Z4Z9_9NEIS|nr:DUF2635 domain-containing protein [Pseudogulbenkiania ferrooxidans]EEG08231.1 hypothetical protein FuraDRAFT_2434 [Pseudogulbenkiania ferrooxidans 2002]